MKLLKIALCVSATAWLIPAAAETVLMDENFDSDYSKSFNAVYDADQNIIASDIRSLFVASGAGDEVQPWWIVRDTSTSFDKQMASWSWFREPAQCSKWLVSVPLDIESTGFRLEFDAQSVCVRDLDRLSDLAVYITDELIDVTNLPTIPTQKFTAIPYGEEPEMMENDWTHYTMSLDDFAGKTIYINFVNESYDKDILAIDNVRVYREDAINMTVDAPESYVSTEVYTLGVNLAVTGSDPVENWVVTVTDDSKGEGSQSGEIMQPGEKRTVVFDIPIPLGETRNYVVTLTAKDLPAQRIKGAVTRLVIAPERKVLIEESTGVWCGNCPIGIYNVEKMLEDPDFKDNIVPVSVHYPGDREYMVCEEYANWLMNFTDGNVAPWFVLNRMVSTGVTEYDKRYNPSNEQTLAHKVKKLIDTPTHIRIKVSGEFNISGNDTVSIRAKAVVASGRNESEGRYKIGFILKENNVGFDNAGTNSWAQHNYVSGTPYEDKMNGWTELPSSVRGYRWQEVARSVSGFFGMPGSLPKVMEAGKDYEFSHTLAIPETRYEGKTGNLLSNPVHCDYLVLVAYVIDTETGEIVNCDAYPMSDVAENRYTTRDCADKYNGVDDIELDDNAPAQYFDLQGRRVVNPAAGIYVSRKAGKSAKVVVK